MTSRRPFNSPDLRHQLSVRPGVTVRSKQGQEQPVLGGREGLRAAVTLDHATRQIDLRPAEFDVVRKSTRRHMATAQDRCDRRRRDAAAYGRGNHVICTAA